MRVLDLVVRGSTAFFFLVAPCIALAFPGDTNLDNEISVSDVQCVVLAVMAPDQSPAPCLGSTATADVDEMVANNGYLTSDNASGVIDAKPFWTRTAYGNTNGSEWTTVAILEPLKEGNYLTPTNIKIYAHSSSGVYEAQAGYTLYFADGTSFSPGSWSTSSLSWNLMNDQDIPSHPAMQSSIVRIDVMVQSASPTWHSAYGKIEVQGFETPPPPSSP